MISLVLVQFLTIVPYHFLTYTCKYDVVTAIHQLWKKEQLEDELLSDDVALLNIVEDTDNYDNED